MNDLFLHDSLDTSPVVFSDRILYTPTSFAKTALLYLQEIGSLQAKKDTLRKHFRYWECDDLRSTIEQAIYYFNNERPARKLKGKPPVPYRTELVA